MIFGSALVVRERRKAKSAAWIGPFQAMRLRIDADRLRAAAVRAAVGRGFEGDVAEPAVEIAVIRRAAEFSVGREPQTDARLQGDRFLDRAILGGGQRRLVDLAAREARRRSSRPAGRNRLPTCSARKGGNGGG